MSDQLAAVAVAGMDRPAHAHILASITHNASMSAFRNQPQNSKRLGDKVTGAAWKRGLLFADFTYLSTPYTETEKGGYVYSGDMRWRDGCQQTFSRPYRALPLFLDSCGYRREITGSAPKWAMNFDAYPEAIELLDPDGYAAWDYPQDRERSLAALSRLSTLFPGDGRLWPVFSIRWTWSDKASFSTANLPGWNKDTLANLIPVNRTQKELSKSKREQIAHQAIANALIMASDPDFQMMADTYGQVMIGGLVGCSCHRSARHLIAAVLNELFPGVKIWLLGQANHAVVNGLGVMGLLDQVWTDGTWWLRDAVAERFSYIENGLITVHSFEKGKRERNAETRNHTFFTIEEMMIANLRSLLAAYGGLWTWPSLPGSIDLQDMAHILVLKNEYQVTQLAMDF